MEEKKLTGYPSIDRPWLQYYSEEAIHAELPECTIYEYRYMRNQKHLENVALHYYGNRITYRKLFEEIERVARALWSIGIRKGDIVPMLVTNCPETIYIIYALNMIGAIPDMEYPTLSSEELDAAIHNAAARTVILLDVLQNKFSNVLDMQKNVRFISISPSDSLPTISKAAYRCKPYQDHYYGQTPAVPLQMLLRQYASSDYRRAPYIKNSAAIILHSGGTTGVPKGVVLTNENQNAIAFQFLYSNVGFSSGESFMHGIPSFHAFGFAVGIHMPLCYCLRLHLITRFDESSVVKSFFLYKPNHFIGGTLHAKRIIASVQDKKNNLRWLITFGCGGASLPSNEEAEMNRSLGLHNSKSKTLVGYGLSETCAVVCTELNRYCVKPGSVGCPFPKVNVKVIDPDTKLELQYMEQGELYFASCSLFKEYFGNPEETEKALEIDKNGVRWLHTGDLGYVDKDGFVFVTGRIKRIYATIHTSDGEETIYKIFPDYIARVINDSPCVASCAVICVPDKRHKNIAVAFICLSDNASADAESEIRAHCAKKLPGHSIPKRFRFVKEIPITSVGKIDYRALEQMDLNEQAGV